MLTKKNGILSSTFIMVTDMCLFGISFCSCQITIIFVLSLVRLPQNKEIHSRAIMKYMRRLLKQQNRYLWVILVCGYFSVIRSFTWLNHPSESNSYHKTSLSVRFGCWYLSGIPLFPLHFSVYTIAWQRKFEPQWVLNTNLCILSSWKVKYQPLSLRVY